MQITILLSFNYENDIYGYILGRSEKYWDFIAADNSTKATEVSQEIIDYCLRYLSIVPQMGGLLQNTPEIRKLTGPYEYSIVFQRTEQEIHILMVYKRAQRRW